MKIKQLLNYDLMKEVMNAPMEYFYQFGNVHITEGGLIYIHRDIGANILAVAHLDSVNPHNHFYVNNFAGDDIVFSTRVDDRLGAYLILFVLPAMGINADLLLTEGEEVGKSTAKYFTTDKQYRWMYSFDRKGIDAVHYRYTDNKWMQAMRKVFKDIMHGSVSDIDYLHHLKCCGLNVGTGYHDEHNIMAYANMRETIQQLGRFMQFYQNNKKIWYEYTQIVTPPKPAAAPIIPYSRLPASEEPEEPEDEFNPYEIVVTDFPLDLQSYISLEGVVIYPIKCAFCLDILTEEKLHVFMGICRDCERWAVQCAECEEYYCRTDEPSEEMGRELFYGLCPVCSENWRYKDTDETTGFQDTSERDRKWWRNNDDDQGDETNSVNRIN